MSLFDHACEYTARYPEYMKTFRKWGYIAIPVYDSDDGNYGEWGELWVPRTLAVRWEVPSSAFDCYLARASDGQWFEPLLDRWGSSYIGKLEQIGTPRLRSSTRLGREIPPISAEVAFSMMLLTEVEALVADLNKPLDIVEYGCSFGALATLSFDALDVRTYTFIDSPPVLYLVRVILNAILPKDKFDRLVFIDAKSVDENMYWMANIDVFISASSYSLSPPKVRKLYYENLIDSAPVGIILDNPLSRENYDKNDYLSNDLLLKLQDPGFRDVSIMLMKDHLKCHALGRKQHMWFITKWSKGGMGISDTPIFTKFQDGHDEVVNEKMRFTKGFCLYTIW